MAKKAAKRKGDRLPSYRLHKASGQGIVTLSGKDHYLGGHGTPKSKKRYQEIVAQWLAGGKQPMKPTAPADADDDDDGLTVAELVLQFLVWADGHYRKNGASTQEPSIMRYATRPLVEMFGALGVNDFGPLALRSVRDEMVRRDMNRQTVNGFTHKIRFIFRWGVGRELVKPEVIVALGAVESLQKGRTEAREPTPTTAPPEGWFEEIIDHVREPVRTGLILQRFTGMRQGEVRQMRPCDLDTTGPTWWYAPPSHKTEHHGMARRIAIGPKGQAALRPMLEGLKPTDLVFVYRSGRGKGNPISAIEYSKFLQLACDQMGMEYHRPHALRHLRLTEVRASLGLEAAQAVGGHSSANMTERYALLTAEKAEQAAKESG